MSTSRYTQSKAEAAKHSEILRAMLKRPENKLCADCKRNDPRWASTNLGCFMCIRCSGIHRGLGVHISRVRSVDLDTWAPEQIVQIQRWGNRRANAYWEAHLKAGHAPPEHKMDSFIRSKYESKRWAMDGPVPEPEQLDGPDDVHAPSASSTSVPTSTAPTRINTTSNRNPTSPIDLLAGPPSSSSNSRSALSPPSLTSSSSVQMSSPVLPSLPSSPKITAPSTITSSTNGGGGGLFDLDFNSTSAPITTKKDTKADILSLFSSIPNPPIVPRNNSITQPSNNSFGGLSSFGGLNMGSSTIQQQQQQPVQTNNQWVQTTGGNDGGFGAFESFSTPQPPPPQQQQQQQQSNDLFSMPSMSSGSSANVWGSSNTSTTPAVADPFDFGGGFNSNSNSNGGAQKKSNDAFSDIWS